MVSYYIVLSSMVFGYYSLFGSCTTAGERWRHGFELGNISLGLRGRVLSGDYPDAALLLHLDTGLLATREEQGCSMRLEGSAASI